VQLIANIRYALRQFLHASGFTATVVLTLALGIGATTAIFTLVHQVLLRSLPVSKPNELYQVGDLRNCCVNGGLQLQGWSLFSYDKYKTFRDNTPGFAELAAFQAGISRLGVRRTGASAPAESQLGEYVSGNYFSMWGIGALAGRVITPADDQIGAPPVAVISCRLWQQKYGADPSVLGATFTANGQPFTVIGIAPPGFFGDRTNILTQWWFPLSDEKLIAGANSFLEFPTTDWLDVVGRIKPGADVPAMSAHMQVELQDWLLSPIANLTPSQRPLVSKQTLHLEPGGAGIQEMRQEYESGLRILTLISAFVLLIACANVANLMLVRAAARKEQASIRVALGAPPSSQIAQVLIESAVLALLGGIVGVAIAFAGTKLILHLAFPTRLVALSATPSYPVLAFTFAVSLLTGVLFGVAPAWFTMRTDPADALRGARRSTGRSSWLQKSLVITQVALSLALLCAAALLTESLRHMESQDFGFQTPNRYILHIDPQMAGYKAADLDAFYRRLHESLAAVPGVSHVSFSMYSPMEGDNWGETVYIEGQASPPPDSYQNVTSWVRVTDGYFETLGTKVIEGRTITEQDGSTTRRVALVDQAFEKHFFNGQSALGKHFGVIDEKYAGTYEIVGVTENTKYRLPNPAYPIRPMYFLPAAQWMQYDEPKFVSFENMSHYLDAIEVQTQGNIAGLEPQLRQAIGQVNPNLAVIDFTGFADQVMGNFNQQQMIATLTSLFGALALILASVGLYGLMAYSVERRTQEIGIRMALGADAPRIVGLILRNAFVQVRIGIAIGIPVAILGGHAAASKLFGVRPYDPYILLAAVAVLGITAFIAAFVPARRAAALEPVRALRTD
jgi:predicted permease